ncbi:MAG: hypothetical protein EBR20_05435 [Bacteroidetes bacterium]|nr:hypothetical protein [Bacteroidota bacterium]
MPAGGAVSNGTTPGRPCRGKGTKHPAAFKLKSSRREHAFSAYETPSPLQDRLPCGSPHDRGTGCAWPVDVDPSDSGDTLTGPTLHAGVGWVKPLRESVLFYEVVPALVIGAEKVAVAIPFRIGVIF